MTVKATNSVNITNNAEAKAAIERWKALKEIEKAAVAAKKERVALEESILDDLFTPGIESLVVRGVNAMKVSSLRKNTSIDQATLKAAWPDAFAATAKVSEFRFYTAS